MTHLLSRYKRDLALRGFSPRTQDHYYRNTKQFLNFYKLPPEQLSAEKIKDYLYCLITEKKASDSKIRQAHGAIKYLFTQTLSRDWEIDPIPQLKKKKKLPTVFSVQEVFSLFDAGANLKHQTMLILIYSSGLRVGELPNITLTDIKRDKRKLLVRQGKGGKDRYTLLSDICLGYLDNYWKRYRPADYLFPGRGGKNPLSVRACQHAFYLAKEKAGIKKDGGIHTLRHSFATHFLESGGGIFQLQKLLGHKALKTTLVYAHVQEEKIIARSPLDVYGKGKCFDCK